MYGKRNILGLQLGAAKIAAVAAVMGVVATGSYAFMASNTVAVSPAGESESSAVTGFTSGTPTWGLDTADPTLIHQVSFSLSTVTANTVVYAGADNGTTIGWSSACVQGTITAGSATETCTFSTEPSVNTLSKLAISAVD
jgi:hypothetical protein